jgi:hypothetical protein
MSIAVAPSKVKQDGRDPLRPKTPLPSRWGNCYHFAHDHLLVRIPHIPAGTELEAISREETKRHSKSIQRDLRRRTAQEHNYWLHHERPPRDRSPAAHDSDVTLLEMQDEPMMTIRIPHDLDLLAEVPNPTVFIQQQWYLMKM